MSIKEQARCYVGNSHFRNTWSWITWWSRGAEEQRSKTLLCSYAPTGDTKVYIIRMGFLIVELRAQEQSFSIIYY